MVFGYMNRNYEELLDVPVGAQNKFEPGEAGIVGRSHTFIHGGSSSFSKSACPRIGARGIWYGL